MTEEINDDTKEYTNKNWYLLYCKSREEGRAQTNLENQGVESFFPTIQIEKILRKQKVVVDEALFPSYLFVYIDPEDPVFPRIRSTRGVFDFVRFNKKISIVSKELVNQLKSLSKDLHQVGVAPKKLFKKGDKIEIKSGPFKGIEAIYACHDGLERSILLLNVLNKEQKLPFDNTNIKKAGK